MTIHRGHNANLRSIVLLLQFRGLLCLIHAPTRHAYSWYTSLFMQLWSAAHIRGRFCFRFDGGRGRRVESNIGPLLSVEVKVLCSLDTIHNKDLACFYVLG